MEPQGKAFALVLYLPAPHQISLKLHITYAFDCLKAVLPDTISSLWHQLLMLEVCTQFLMLCKHTHEPNTQHHWRTEEGMELDNNDSLRR